MEQLSCIYPRSILNLTYFINEFQNFGAILRPPQGSEQISLTTDGMIVAQLQEVTTQRKHPVLIDFNTDGWAYTWVDGQPFREAVSIFQKRTFRTGI
jgi:hypothetical protein